MNIFTARQRIAGVLAGFASLLPAFSPRMVKASIALVLLVAYAITGTSLVPALASFAAMLDGSHTVMVRQSEQGTRLTLLHEQAHYTPRVDDHGGALARLVVSMCAATDTGSHELDSSHINATSRAERDLEVVDGKTAPRFNWQATQALPDFRMSCDVSREMRDDLELQIPCHFRIALSAVRLLI
jgi:hypothetical protein